MAGKASKVFVSYSRKDKNFVELLIREMNQRNENTTEDDGLQFELWSDSKIEHGDDWANAIDDNIRKSFAVIVVVTESSMNSSFVTYEWSLAMGLGIQVLPLMLQEGAEIHPKLSKIQWADFTNFQFPWDKLHRQLKTLQKTFLESNLAVATALRLFDLGREQYELNNIPDALDALHDAESFANQRILDNIYYYQALCHERQDEEADVERCLELVLQHNSKHVQSLIELAALNRRQGTQAEKEGDIQKRDEEFEAAEQLFRQALRIQSDILDKSGESVWGSLGGIIRRRALIHEQNGEKTKFDAQIDEAIDCYKKATLVKKSSYPFNNLGLLYMKKQNVKQMKENFKLVELFAQSRRMLDPSDEWVHNDYFISKVVIENIPDAREALQTVLVIAPKFALTSLLETLSNIDRLAKNDTLKGFEDNDAITAYIAEAIDLIEQRIGVLDELDEAV